MAALIFAGLAGLADGAALPAPVDVDPGSLSQTERTGNGIAALPSDLLAATEAFAADAALPSAFGTELAATIVDVRRAESARFEGAEPEDVVAALLWKY